MHFYVFQSFLEFLLLKYLWKLRGYHQERKSFLINFYSLCGVFISSVNKISSLSRIDGNLTKLDLDNGKLIQKRKGYFLVKSPRFIFSSLVMSVESRGIAIRETRYKVFFEGKRRIKLTMILHNVKFLKKAWSLSSEIRFIFFSSLELDELLSVEHDI